MKKYIKAGLNKATNWDLISELRKRVTEEKRLLGERAGLRKTRLEQQQLDISDQLDQLDDIQSDLEGL